MPTPRSENVSVFSSIALPARVRARAPPPPPAADVAVHLRVGDVIDAAPHAVARFLESAEAIPFWNGGTYVKPLRYYEALAAALPAAATVTLFYGFHQRRLDATKSRAYVAAVRKVFEGRGFAVEEDADGDPDAAFVRMARARTFVRGGGGFSALIARLRELL